jgi:hypothetical protein
VNGAEVIVKDLGSTNGTFLNRAPVQEATLMAGHHLQLGGVEMELIADPPVSAPAPMSIRLATATASPSANPTVGAPISATSPTAVSSAAPRIALRVTAHETPAAPARPEPAVFVPDEYAERPGAGPAMCKYHPKTAARFLCTHCQLNYCDLCVTSRPGGQRTGMFCRRCSNECVGLNVQLVREGAEKENFFATIPGAFAYPVKGSGLMFLICGTLFFSLVNFLGDYSLYLRIVYVGYTFAYVQRVIQTAAQASDEAAGWPDISEFWQDIMIPFFQTLGIFLICFGPAIGLGFWVGWEALANSAVDPQKLVLIAAAVAAGAVYLPMAFLALAMFDSVVSCNPLVVIPAMLRAPLEYLTILVITGLIFSVKIVQTILLSFLAVPVIPELIAAGIGLYFLTVQARMLGLMYFAKRQKLGWFNR